MKILQSKILLAILACLIVLVGIGGYFYSQKEEEKRIEAETQKFLYEDSGIDVKEIFGKKEKKREQEKAEDETEKKQQHKDFEKNFKQRLQEKLAETKKQEKSKNNQ